MAYKLTTAQAVLTILSSTRCSKYRLAQQLKVNPIMINNYIRHNKPNKMGVATAALVLELFDITVTDVYNPIKEVVVNDDTKGLSD